MKNKLSAIGIDVAKATLSICFHYDNGSEKILNIRNTDTDMKRLILPKMKNFKGKIVMESTSHYHWTPSIILTDNDYDVYVVNPLLAKQYVSGNIRKIKSDPADASALARMARVADNLPKPFKKSRKSLFLRKKLGLLASLSKEVQAIKANLKSLKEAQVLLDEKGSIVIKKLEESIKMIEKQMRELENECVKEMKKDRSQEKKMELLTSIPGVSEFAATLCLHWFNLSKDISFSSWIAYAGLDISVRESGTWRGKCRLTKRGNAFLRKRLYSCAWGAWRNDSDFEKYYLKLKEEGRSHKEILVIIARKIVRIAFMVLKNNKPYDSALCF